MRNDTQRAVDRVLIEATEYVLSGQYTGNLSGAFEDAIWNCGYVFMPCMLDVLAARIDPTKPHWPGLVAEIDGSSSDVDCGVHDLAVAALLERALGGVGKGH